MTARKAFLYFPAVCSRAHRPFLTPLIGDEGEALSPRCPQCGAPARIIPGSQYTTQNERRFEESVDLIVQYELGPETALLMVTFLDSLVRKPESEVRAALAEVLQASTLAVFTPERLEELIAFVSLLSGFLAVRAEAAMAAPKCQALRAAERSE